MTNVLPKVAHEHHERLMVGVDRMPAIGDMLLTAPEAELAPKLEELESFLTGTLLPHMDTAEPTLYPELERMLQNRHSMTPMRREHAEIRRLTAEFAGLRVGLRDAKHTLRKVVAARRVVFGLYSLLKIHIAEEEMYIRIIDHDATAEASEVLAAALEHHVGVAE